MPAVALRHPQDIAHNATKVHDQLGQIPFGAWLFPGLIDGNPVNWTLAGIEEHRNQRKLALLGEVSRALSIKTLLSPSPIEFNGRICNRDELTKSVAVDHARNARIFRGTNADGIIVPPSEAYVVSVGGCAVVVMTLEDRMVAFHAGFKCLYDHTCMTTGKRHPDRTFESVIISAAHALSTDYVRRPAKLRAYVLFPLSPEVLTYALDDARHSSSNRLLVDYFRKQWGSECGVEQRGTDICVDTVKLITAQCQYELGMDPSQVHFGGIYADKIPHAHHTRSGPTLKDNRNLVVLKNENYR